MKTITQRIVAIMLAIIIGLCMASAQTKTAKHIVERGETLASIAKRYGITENQIIELNPDASQFIYVGMELTVPITASGTGEKTLERTSSETSSFDTQRSTNRKEFDKYSYTPTETKDVLHKSFVVAQYQLGDFREARYSSSYGLGIVFSSISHWDALHVGGDLNFSINAGIVDNWGCMIDFGPSVRYDFADNIFVNVPGNIRCAVTFPEGSTDTETHWGLQIPPAIHVFFTEKFGLFVGPEMTIGFDSGSKPSFGLVTGLSYEF